MDICDGGGVAVVDGVDGYDADIDHCGDGGEGGDIGDEESDAVCNGDRSMNGGDGISSISSVSVESDGWRGGLLQKEIMNNKNVNRT